MKKKDYKGLELNELKSSIETNKTTLMKMKISNKVSQLENPIQLRNMRKEIARLSTELRSKELQAK